MNDINQWMVAHKYAKNIFSANHIFNGLRLFETPRFWERVRRVVLYRKWRDAGENPSIAYQNVLDGKHAPLELKPFTAFEEREAS